MILKRKTGNNHRNIKAASFLKQRKQPGRAKLTRVTASPKPPKFKFQISKQSLNSRIQIKNSGNVSRKN